MLYRKQVRDAAYTLNLRAPQRARWADTLDLARLDLRSPTNCVLGQLFGKFSLGRSALYLDEYEGAHLRVAFGIGVNALTRTLVDRAWRREVRRWRAPMSVATLRKEVDAA